MTMSANGRTDRKSLAGQLDRLDLILDGLADGLNEAVATAVKQAVTAAVEAALIEVLTSAELQARLRPEPTGKPGWARRAASVLWRSLVSAAKGCWAWGVTLIGQGRTRAAQAVLALREHRAVIVGRVRRGLTAFIRKVWLGWFLATRMICRFRKPLLLAAGVGTALAVACYLAGPAVSSLVNGVVGFAATLAAEMLARLQPARRRLANREWDVGRTP